MERLSEILEQSGRRTSLHSQKTFEELPAEEMPAKDELCRRLNLMSLNNTFEAFKPIRGTAQAVAAFRALASGKATWHMLLCNGTVGCGKTHLCEALAIAWARNGILCRVWEWSEVVRNFKRAMNAVPRTYDNVFENFRRQERLIIDDIGMASAGSSWEWGEVEDIVGYRYRRDMVTVVTTNLDLKELPDRVLTRFRDAIKGKIVNIKAEDYRPKKIA